MRVQEICSDPYANSPWTQLARSPEVVCCSGSGGLSGLEVSDGFEFRVYFCLFFGRAVFGVLGLGFGALKSTARESERAGAPYTQQPHNLGMFPLMLAVLNRDYHRGVL